MQLKAVTRYQLNDYIKSVRIFYLVILLICIFFGSATYVLGDSYFHMGGMEMSTIIFLFIMGLNSFKEPFLMSLQNSVSRKTMFYSRLLTILIISGLMAVIDRLIINIASLFGGVNKKFVITGMYEIFFENRVDSLNIIIFNLEAILITIFVYISVVVGGYLITAAYYRMNKTLKVVVSIGFPSTLFIFLPLLDSTVFNGNIVRLINKTLRFIFEVSPYNLLLTCVLSIVICIGLSWLLIRKAVEKS